MRLASPALLALCLLLAPACAGGDKGGFGRVPDDSEIDEDGDGYTADVDCDDADGATTPDTVEICDGIDNDCDGIVDENGTPDSLTWYLDEDGDGFGAGGGIIACYPEDTWVSNDDDCDDSDDDRYPGNQETCDGFDQDCDGQSDENAIDPDEWYADQDEDGYGDANNTRLSCEQPPGYLMYGTDCEDGDASINPGAEEVCDGIDNDCDGSLDEIREELYLDADGDGYGDPTHQVDLCDGDVSGVDDAEDCDDADATVNPDAEEVEDGIDNDCDGDVL